MNGVFIIPTGIGCEIGGHAGDATPAAKLIAECCDILLIHPNVVNASDINEMTGNMWYVEGSMLDRFLRDEIVLRRPRQNKILVVVNKIKPEIVNAVSAARNTIGMDAAILELTTPLKMVAKFQKDGTAGGDVTGWRELVKQVEDYEFDALAINTVIDCEKTTALNYFKNMGVNPWGGIEAITSKLISDALNKPVAHAPVEEESASTAHYDFVGDPRVAAELISSLYLHCVLKGLYRAPRIEKPTYPHLKVTEVDFMVTPWGCWGEPHEACSNLGVPVIAVKENRCVLNKKQYADYEAETYLDAAGYIMAMRAGINISSLRRPATQTNIFD